jgi:hypothetical protein
MQTGKSIISWITTILVIFTLIQTTFSSNLVQKISKINWDVAAKNDYNKGCYYDSHGICAGSCLGSTKSCVELINYDTKVCGCPYCKFNSTTKICNGQGSNLILESCVNRVPNPKSDSDCMLSSCTAEFIEINYDYDYESEKILIPSCDPSTCSGNACLPVYVMTNSTAPRNLECICLNNKKN